MRVLIPHQCDERGERRKEQMELPYNIICLADKSMVDNPRATDGTQIDEPMVISAKSFSIKPTERFSLPTH